jgi:CPA1 family monovalent cation:H+ antiporter
VNAFDVAAILLAVAAAAGYLNHRLLRLPATSGILLVSVASSLALLAVDGLVPGRPMDAAIQQFLAGIDFNEALMHGMLSFLLFAGALHVDFGSLSRQRWTVGLLATVAVALSTWTIGLLTYGAGYLLGLEVPLIACLLFGALISPTDPIAVMGLLKELRAPEELEAQIAGESLFNDGVGVVIFFAILSIAGFGGAESAAPAALSGMVVFFLIEVLGGVALGLGLGYLGYVALKSLDDHPLELLITLALVMFTYATSFWVHVSGPIAVVVAGLLIGNHGRRFAMSDRTREHVDAFWRMIDDILNAVLFLLIGLQVFTVPSTPSAIVAGLLAIPITLVGRFVSVSLPVGAMQVRTGFVRGIVPILTWGGLRGGISVAMALSLPDFEAKGLLLTCTYAVVLFSILVQGLTMRRLLAHFGVGDVSAPAPR